MTREEVCVVLNEHRWQGAAWSYSPQGLGHYVGQAKGYVIWAKPAKAEEVAAGLAAKAAAAKA